MTDSNHIIGALNQLLADYQVFYQRTRNYHWNVTGQMFFLLHEKFEELYLSVAEQVDALAERVRTLKGHPVSTLGEQLKLARLKEDTGTPEAEDMVKNVIADMEFLNEDLRKSAKLAEGQNDMGTMAMLDGIADGQEKTLWMLRSLIK